MKGTRFISCKVGWEHHVTTHKSLLHVTLRRLALPHSSLDSIMRVYVHYESDPEFTMVFKLGSGSESFYDLKMVRSSFCSLSEPSRNLWKLTMQSMAHEGSWMLIESSAMMMGKSLSFSLI